MVLLAVEIETNVQDWHVLCAIWRIVLLLLNLRQCDVRRFIDLKFKYVYSVVVGGNAQNTLYQNRERIHQLPAQSQWP